MLVGFDFSNLLIRHAANPYNTATDQQGRDVSGVIGAIRQINRICQELSPTHAVIARDDSRHNLKRMAESPEYKIDRPEADDNLGFQFELAWLALNLLGIPETLAPEYEADDVLASAAERFSGPVMIVTGDKDLLALCSDRVTIRLLRPGKVIDCGPDECRQIVGVTPDRVGDYKALAGDRGDGIPGVPSIGHKRALALLEAYGSLEDLLAAPLPLPDFPPGISRTLEENRHLAEMSFRLAQMERGLDSFDLAEYRPTPGSEQLSAALQDIGLAQLSPAQFGDLTV
jgi:DNA polymerase-1